LGRGGQAGRSAATYTHRAQLGLAFTGRTPPAVMATILSDEEVFAQFNQDSRKACKRSWAQFVEFNPEFDFEAGSPGDTLSFHAERPHLLAHGPRDGHQECDEVGG
jgi:hypothetical protein